MNKVFTRKRSCLLRVIPRGGGGSWGEGAGHPARDLRYLSPRSHLPDVWGLIASRSPEVPLNGIIRHLAVSSAAAWLTTPLMTASPTFRRSFSLLQLSRKKIAFMFHSFIFVSVFSNSSFYQNSIYNKQLFDINFLTLKNQQTFNQANTAVRCKCRLFYLWNEWRSPVLEKTYKT